MNNLFKTTLSLAAFAGLAACGGGSTSTNPYQTLQNRTDAYLEQIDRVSALYPSGPATMNNASGTATYSGTGSIVANPTFIGETLLYADATLLGDADLYVNFGANRPTLNGSITDLFGIDSNDNVDEYTGTVQVRNGYIGDDTHNSVTASYAGTIRGNGDTISLNGNMYGTVLGNPSPRVIDLIGFGDSTIGSYQGTSIVGVTVERD